MSHEKLPPLLYTREPGAQIVVAVVVPLAFGAITGIMLGVSELIYVVLSLLGIAGGFFAGIEHDRPLEGFYRGLLGGVLFGFAILWVHGVLGAEAKAHLIHPETTLIIFTGGFGTGLGVLGARWREKREREHAAATAHEDERFAREDDLAEQQPFDRVPG